MTQQYKATILQYMNEWMNEFLKKEHTRPPRTCGNEESTPRVQHSARTALTLVHCQRPAWTRPLYPRDLDAEAGRQPVAVSPVLCSCSRSHAEAEVTGRTRDPHSASGQQARPLSLTSRTSRCRFTFISLDLRCKAVQDSEEFERNKVAKSVRS